jgi:hypothetical protein
MAPRTPSRRRSIGGIPSYSATRLPLSTFEEAGGEAPLPGLSCRHHSGLIHEANSYPVWAVACLHIHCGGPCRRPRRKATVVALQCAQCGSSFSARQACGIRVGFRGLLVPMRVLLCVGNGRLLEGRRAGPLPEIDQQMRPLLPARMSDLGRSSASNRVPLGILGLQPAGGHFARRGRHGAVQKPMNDFLGVDNSFSSGVARLTIGA